MEKSKASPKKKSIFITPLARVSYASLYKAKAYEDQDAKFSCDLIFKAGEDLSGLEKAIHAAKVLQWGKDKSTWPKKLRSPIKDGDEKEGQPEYAGRMYITPANKHKPYVVDRKREHISEESDDFYSGCFVYGVLTVKAYDTKANKGVSLYLEGVQKVKDGERFGGSSKPEDALEDLGDDEDNQDDMGADDDLDEDIGF